MMDHVLQLVYLLAAVSFMVGLKMLSRPDSARRGNAIAAIGMTLAIFATIFLFRGQDGSHLGNLPYIFIALVVGSAIGYLMAKRVQMTAMPQMVSFFNGMGGACAAMISLIEYGHLSHAAESGDAALFQTKIPIILAGLVIGAVSFSGSMVAYGKLEGKLKDLSVRGQQFVNMSFLLGILLLSVLFALGSLDGVWFYLILGLSLVYGLLFVFPIGGADMPVVISLLNSFTGVAAACGGFLYDNYVMLIGGILVGSAGTILTVAMCKAMNRSLTNVLVGNFGGGGASGVGSAGVEGTTKEISLSDAAVLMKYAKKVVIVPGYGLAVAQAQHVCHEIETLLEDEGVEVKYAIHPVAGRMPGHMNVLLAESNVSYDKLVEMEDINPEFKSTDVVLVVGANDVVNPAAKTGPSSPIFGMPILDVEDSRNIIVLKRSMKAGYAGIENALFYEPQTFMLFGDAKDSLTRLVAEIKSN
ncbi:MAG: NAD(P)(+) transhydrogenase (Re/Si-specific) subunit beta [Saprospiraceae bacterium]|nr:NAD(P)(+) transhydrogenase (Re/Si-specific) subunit beta [Saprospiraceae bacterium]